MFLPTSPRPPSATILQVSPITVQSKAPTWRRRREAERQPARPANPRARSGATGRALRIDPRRRLGGAAGRPSGSPLGRPIHELGQEPPEVPCGSTQGADLAAPQGG